MEKLYQTYKNHAEFFLVYIREAHPDSVLAVEKSGKTTLEKLGQTNTLEERSERATLCSSTLKLTMPVLVDKADNKVNQAYAGWPDRLIVVDKDGKLAYIGGPGPAGFKPGEVEAWLKKLPN